MPNTFAYLALLSWPLVAIIIYRIRWMSTLTATFWVVVGGYLLLPAGSAGGIDLPMVPELDQITIPSISAAACCILIRRVSIKLIPDGWLMRLLFLCLMLAPSFAVMTNPEVIFDGERLKPGLTAYDAIADTMDLYLELLPMLLGLSLVKGPRDIAKLLKLIIYAGILYSPLIMLEVRLSPQLHDWVYGYFPHDFSQQIRFDGFRPVVFLGHGLLVAAFIAVILCAATILWQQQYRMFRQPMVLFVVYFAAILILCKSVGAWILGFGTLACIVALSSRMQIWVSIVIALLVVTYPLLAINGFIPYEKLVAFASIFGNDRAGSLEFRFIQESQLLAHAAKKMSFGWGIWGRHQFYNTVSDGHWIGVLGVYGTWGYIAKTGLLLGSIVLGARAAKRFSSPRAVGLTTGSLLIVMLIMVDQIPNASLSPYFWLLLGGIQGVSSRVLGGALARRSKRESSSEERGLYIGGKAGLPASLGSDSKPGGASESF